MEKIAHGMDDYASGPHRPYGRIRTIPSARWLILFNFWYHIHCGFAQLDGSQPNTEGILRHSSFQGTRFTSEKLAGNHQLRRCTLHETNVVQFPNTKGKDVPPCRFREFRHVWRLFRSLLR
uniref:Uncharacterized protein n=1 Tax=Schistocephalus solidus TaxID=70667 RepID=A0A0X3P1Q7_SCHSO